jgi:hypothetical protein
VRLLAFAVTDLREVERRRSFVTEVTNHG